MNDDTTPDSQPYFSDQTPPSPAEEKRQKRAEYQRRYRERKSLQESTRNNEESTRRSPRVTRIDISDSPDVNDLEISTSSLHNEESTRNTRNKSTRNTRKKEIPTGNTPDVPKMTAENYAEAFQALHMLGAGVTGIPGIAITDAEAAPVGKALKVFADYYGWDPIEKFGPGLLLGFQLTMVEAKVIKRVRVQAPEVKRLKQEAARRKRGLVPEAEPITPVDPVPTAPAAEMTDAQKLRILEEMVSAIPEDMIPSGVEQGPTA